MRHMVPSTLDIALTVGRSIARYYQKMEVLPINGVKRRAELKKESPIEPRMMMRLFRPGSKRES